MVCVAIFYEGDTTMAEPNFGRPVPPRPPADVQRPEPDLAWASELPSSPKNIGQFKEKYTGWFTPTGEHEDLDVAMSDLEVKPLYIKHGSGNIVQHWPIDFHMIPLIERVDTLKTIKTDDTRMGMAIGWRIKDDGRPESFCKFLALHVPLLANGYSTPFLVTVKSRSVQNMVNALIRQYDVLDWISNSRKASGKSPVAYPFWSIAMRMGLGEREVRGTTQTKEYIPFASHLPQVITKDVALDLFYPADHPEWVELIRPLLDNINDWSTEASKPVNAATYTETVTE